LYIVTVRLQFTHINYTYTFVTVHENAHLERERERDEGVYKLTINYGDICLINPLKNLISSNKNLTEQDLSFRPFAK